MTDPTRYQRLAAEGLCGQCGVRPIDRERSRARCSECLAYQRRKHVEHVERCRRLVEWQLEASRGQP